MQQGNRPSVHPQRGPYAPLPKGLPPTAFGRPVGAADRLAGARVLVVEDAADSREIICDLLKMAGAKVLCVGSVAEAMDGVYHSFDPDVVLTDRHVGVRRVRGVLHDADSAASVNGSHAGRAVVEIARQQHADDLASIGHGGGAEQRVDAWSGAVLPSALRDQHLPFDQQQVVVRRGQTDVASLELFPVVRLRARESPTLRSVILAASGRRENRNGTATPMPSEA